MDESFRALVKILTSVQRIALEYDKIALRMLQAFQYPRSLSTLHLSMPTLRGGLSVLYNCCEPETLKRLAHDKRSHAGQQMNDPRIGRKGSHGQTLAQLPKY